MTLLANQIMWPDVAFLAVIGIVVLGVTWIVRRK